VLAVIEYDGLLIKACSVTEVFVVLTSVALPAYTLHADELTLHLIVLT